VTRETLNQCYRAPKAAFCRNSADFSLRTTAGVAGAFSTHSHNVIIDDKPKVVICVATKSDLQMFERAFLNMEGILLDRFTEQTYFFLKNVSFDIVFVNKF